jgi:hypothetical protein
MRVCHHAGDRLRPPDSLEAITGHIRERRFVGGGFGFRL